MGFELRNRKSAEWDSRSCSAPGQAKRSKLSGQLPGYVRWRYREGESFPDMISGAIVASRFDWPKISIIDKQRPISNFSPWRRAIERFFQ